MRRSGLEKMDCATTYLQHRWAKGSIQTAKKLLPRVLQADVPHFTKCQAVLHLTHYLVHPLMLWQALGASHAQVVQVDPQKQTRVNYVQTDFSRD